MAEKYYPDNSMVIGGVDVSLPYDEYVANFRKKYPRAQPMSKYNYELAQKSAKRDAKAIGATKEELDWKLQNGQISKAAYDKQIAALKTPEVQKEMISGTKKADETVWDSTDRDVDDAKAIGATKEELDWKLQNGQISKAAYDKQIAALKTPEVQKEMISGTKKADETVWDSTDRDETENANNELTDSVSEVVTPKKDDPSGVIQSKNKYNKSMMSIWDAYRDGEISKETAGYFTIDAIATLAKNLGRSIGNVGAQFSGGTIDNGHDESKWGQRQNALLNEEIGKETESLGGAAGRQAESENIANLEARIRAEYSPKMLDLEIKNLENEVKKSGIDVTKAENSQALIEHIKQDPDYEKSLIKKLLVGFLSQTGVGGAVNTGASALEKLALLRGK